MLPVLFDGLGRITPTLPLPLGTCTPSNACFFEPIRVSNPNSITIGSAVFSGLTNVTNSPTDRQTDWPRYFVCNNRPPSLTNTAVRPNSSKILYPCVYCVAHLNLTKTTFTDLGQWVMSARYLGVYLASSTNFKCSFSHNKTGFFKQCH